MGEHVQQLARLRTATATGVLPRDLGIWALDLLAELEPAAERVERRNELLHAAAARLSGSTWARARRLERELAELDALPRRRTRASDDDGIREVLARALEADPETPRSLRHLYRVLAR
ncbi:hypothetical protein [Anaeromyxobacter terrae]|uniref:hypothetical protein n=1 Tax=Anaeromyxobacter terrae TaxID=2925406 RepID=UPI001F59BA2F|nr:hypothetical protein [Anaeromyxobacter sp. SG22]